MVLIVGVGTPAAYFLATRRFRGRGALITLIELPLVLPPAVAGIALLAAVGPAGLLGGAIEDAGLQLTLATAGVVVALTFVAAPFHMRQAIAAFEAVDPTLLDASRTLGASPARTFLRVAVPAALPGLVAGTALALGRALGEFGATLMFAGSFRGITQTVPLAIYDRFSTDFTSALALSAVLVAISAALLLVGQARAPGRRRDPRGRRPRAARRRRARRAARGRAGRVPRAGGAQRRGQDERAAHRRRAAARPTTARSACGGGDVARHRGTDVPPERRRCGYVFQEYALFGHLSAWRNVAYGLRRLPRARARAARAGAAGPLRPGRARRCAARRRCRAASASASRSPARWRASPAVAAARRAALRARRAHARRRRGGARAR